MGTPWHAQLGLKYMLIRECVGVRVREPFEQTNEVLREVGSKSSNSNSMNEKTSIY
jgi:hypothetical protein